MADIHSLHKYSAPTADSVQTVSVIMDSTTFHKTYL